MIKELTILANRLDSKGRVKEADYLDGIIRKLAESPPLPEDVFSLCPEGSKWNEAQKRCISTEAHALGQSPQVPPMKGTAHTPTNPEEEVPHPSLWERIFPAAHKRHALRGLVGWDELGALPGGKEIKKKMRHEALHNPDMSTEEFAAMIQDELSVLRVGEETIVPETQIGTAAISYAIGEGECPKGYWRDEGMKGCCPDGWRDTGTHCESPNSLTETDHEGHDHGFQ